MIQTTTSPLLTPSRIYYIYTHDFWINFSSLEQFSQKRWATGHPTCISHVGRSSWQRVLMGDSCSEKTLSFRFKFFLVKLSAFCAVVFWIAVSISNQCEKGWKKLQLFSLKAMQPSNNIAKRQPANNNWECINTQVHWNPDLIVNHSKSNYLEVSVHRYPWLSPLFLTHQQDGTFKVLCYFAVLCMSIACSRSLLVCSTYLSCTCTCFHHKIREVKRLF